MVAAEFAITTHKENHMFKIGTTNMNTDKLKKYSADITKLSADDMELEKG